MATQKERAVVDLVINGRAAETNLKDIDRAVSSLRNSLRHMNEADDPAKIARRRQEYQQLVKTQKEMRDRLYGIDRAQKQVEKSGRSMLAEITGGNILADFFQRGVDAALEFGRKIIQTASTFQKFEAVLTNALGDRGKAREALRFLQRFAENTPFEVDQLTDSFVRLVNRGFQPTKDELTSLGDLASSQGKSMEQVVEALLDAETFEFERLKELGIRAKKDGDTVQLAFKGITKEVDASGVAIRQALIDFGKMDGVAGSMEAISKTMGGQISNLSDGWTALALAIGQRAGGAISDVIGSAKTLVGWMTRLVTVPLSEKMEEERIAMNALHIQLMATNEGTDASRKIIKQLIDQYPEYLGHLDADKASHEDVAAAIRTGNKAMIDRIVLQEKLEEVEKKQRFSAQATIEQENAAKNAATAIATLSKEYDILIKDGLDPLAQAKDVLDQLQKQTAWWEAGPFKNMDIKDLERAVSQMESFGVLAESGAKDAETLRKEAEEMAKRLGVSIEPDAVSPKTPAARPVSAGNPAEVKQLEKLSEELKKIREGISLDRLADEDREIEQTRLKYEKLRTQARGNSALLIEITNAESAEILAINEKYQSKRFENEVKLQQKIKEFKAQISLEEADEYEREQLELDAKFQKAIAQANELGLQTTNIQRIWEQAKTDLLREQQLEREELVREHQRKSYEEELRWIEARRKLASLLVASISNMYTAIAGDAAEYTGFSKALTFVQILIDTASAISSAVKSGAAIGLTPIEKALAIAGNIAVVTANIAKATQVLKKAKEPKPPKFADGGFSDLAYSNKPGGFVDVPTFFKVGKREYIAGEKGPEWISPNWMLNNPVTANIIGMLEALRQSPSLARGGFSQQNNRKTPEHDQEKAAFLNVSILVEEIRGLRQDVVNASGRPIDFNVSKYREADAFMTRIMADRDI